MAFISTSYTGRSNTMNINHLVDSSARSLQLLFTSFGYFTVGIWVLLAPFYTGLFAFTERVITVLEATS